MTWTTRPRSEEAGVAFVEAGEGPLLLFFLHGVGLRAEAWGAQIDAFSDRFEVRAPDLPGHGGSVLPGRAERLSAYTDALAACATRPCVVIGHSMGGDDRARSGHTLSRQGARCRCPQRHPSAHRGGETSGHAACGQPRWQVNRRSGGDPHPMVRHGPLARTGGLPQMADRG
ncbi:alpha/beta fold hydrolase [Roseibium salinum]|nr:alpha/beta fold hydrolase [Roseibium salinum]